MTNTTSGPVHCGEASSPADHFLFMSSHVDRSTLCDMVNKEHAWLS